ncbi:16S rRNA (adenine(1518)-N(6)/adenine(1519)-N(6))-dimethyltransferase [Rickettsiella grylli]|uniref:16S rRNA (adenine(1518)-N(6)/adenine(1519)-N(6))- dimethyltransferase RsmA n=1 Tax=Rickettsiella grylli TaxID=59196 RepID=UPI0008FD1061|nr:16S rRNA (adenine(1518)-N(6)/adenine(1519)-N(6))-dimethyltransferase RsmA [Rickettsiella grylli]OIZ98431.1 16S rRNA (adenine(1518)-N(6)/adenine(1519)-N(6))-dimethyltransferase [Rickettsiella grylli]
MSLSFKTRKRFGQHFLHERTIIDKIIHAIAPKKTDSMIEIGPGLGALTEQLVPLVHYLIAIELDKNLIPLLEKKCVGLGEFMIFQGDVLNVDFRTLTKIKCRWRVVGNLPYNISTPLLFHCINHVSNIQDMHFMLQKEVADRINAQPGQSSYGRLSVMIQYYCQVEKLFNVKPGAFRPPPKVDSAVIRLIPYRKLPHKAKSSLLFAEIVKNAFNHRRKMLRNNLSYCLQEHDFEQLGIRSSVRPEQLAVDDYVKLANFVIIKNELEKNN